MKQLENRVTEIIMTDEKGGASKMTYAHLVRYVMNQVVKDTGITSEMMRKNIRVLDEIEKVITGDLPAINLEDADFKHLQDKVKTTLWTFVHKDVIAFENDIEEASKKKE